MSKDRAFGRWWSQAIIAGASFGICVGLFIGYGHDGGLVTGLITGCVSAAIFGLVIQAVIGRSVARQQLRIDSLTVELSPDGRALATTASFGGAVPEDAGVRAAAARIVRYRLNQTTRQAGKNAVVLVLLALGLVWMATVLSPWWWLGVAWVPVLLLAQWLQPRRLRRRLTLLEH